LEVLELQLLLDNHRVLDNRVLEIVLLNLFIIVAFDSITEYAGAILPPPELAALIHHVLTDLHHMVTSFSPVGVEVHPRVLIFSRNEEQGGLLGGGVGYEVLELDYASQHHFYKCIVHPAFPIIIILFHVGRGTCVLHFYEPFYTFQELFVYLSVLFHQFPKGPFQLFLEVVVEVN
jgi:hypothetical protein